MNLKPTKKFVYSLQELLKLLPTCDFEYPRGDSFDSARGDHLCFNKATRQEKLADVRPGYRRKKLCDRHSDKKTHEDLPLAFAYRRLWKFIHAAKDKKKKG